MAIKISGIMIVISVIASFFCGTTSSLTEAALSGGGRALSVVLSLLPLMCLWGGIISVAQKCGALKLISRLMSPIMRLAFPKACKSGMGKEETAAALSANLLGIGNAATPLSLSAARKLEKTKDGDAGDDLITFTLIGCAPPCLFPTTVIALRAAAGSTAPSEILIPTWICSFSLALFSIILSRLVSRIKK